MNITLNPDLKKLYVDEEGNFIFKDYLLAETKFASTNPAQPESTMDELIASFSKVVSDKQESVKDIMKHFLIEKLSPKNKNVESWCEMFEKESSRFNLTGQRQIEIFKSCLDPSMEDWFSVNQRRLPSSAQWTDWKAKLIVTFGDSSWKPIRQAFNFRYLSGSYIDFAVKKEKLLLELDRQLTDLMILDLIVVGLPPHIQNSLNRNSIKSIDSLHNKLKKFEAEDKVLDNQSKSKNFNKIFFSNSNLNQSSGINVTKKINVNPSGKKTSNLQKKTLFDLFFSRFI